MEFNLLIALFFGLPQIHRREANPPAWVATPPSIRVQPKSCDNGVTRKIQVRAVFVARLLIMHDQRGYRSAPFLRTCTPPPVVSQRHVAAAILSREDAYESKRGARENHRTFLLETPR